MSDHVRPMSLSVGESLTREKIDRLLERVRAEAIVRDHEAAHSAEDRLWEVTLRAIRDDRLDGMSPREAAALALQTLGIEFHRWTG